MGRTSWAAFREPRWAALATAFLTLVVVQGVTNSFPVLLLPLAEELGGLRSVAAGVFSLHSLVAGLVATSVDALMRRFGERRVLVLGALVLGGGVALAGTAHSVPLLLLWFGAVGGIGAGLLGSVAQTVMLSRWFPTARGTVNGAAFSGMGVGIFVFAPLTAALIAHLGWRWTLVWLGAGAACVLLPVGLLTPPSPSEWSPGRPADAGPEAASDGIRAIVRTARFWFFAATLFFTPVSNFMVTTHQVAHIMESGYDGRQAAAAFGIVGLLSAVGRIGLGALSDRWSRVPVVLFSFASTATGTLALLLLGPGSPPWLLWAYVLPFGLTLGVRAPIVSALVADVYRGRRFGTVLGLISFGNRIGMAVGPWLGGVIYDVSGSYRWAFAASIVAITLAAASLWLAGRDARD